MPAKKTTKAKATENKEPQGAPKVFDVAKPGETAADASSRPLIVGHGTMIKQDPMVVDPDPAAEPKPVSKMGVSIQPISESKEEKTEDTVPEAKTPTSIKVIEDTDEKKPEKDTKEETPKIEPELEPVKEVPEVEEPKSETAKEEVTEPEPKPETEETAIEETAPEEKTEKTEETTDSEQPGSSEVAATNALANELVAKKAAEEKAKEAAKKAEELQALINSKKYFVNIHQSATSGGAGKWILLLLLLLVVGGVLAIDAGLVETSITLPFDLIKN